MRIDTLQLYSDNLVDKTPYRYMKLLAVQYRLTADGYKFMFSEGGDWLDPYDTSADGGKAKLGGIFKK